MGFKNLIDKVQRTEAALEAQERRIAADLRQLRNAWREAWTPMRIIAAGLATGFLIGRAEPLRSLGKSGRLLQLASTLSGLFAGLGARSAAGEAEQAADSAQAAAEAAPRGPVATSDADALAREEAALQAARAAATDSIEP